MRTYRSCLWLVLIALNLGAAGCTFEEGVQDGIVNGLSDAIAAIITTPVDTVLGALFPE